MSSIQLEGSSESKFVDILGSIGEEGYLPEVSSSVRIIATQEAAEESENDIKKCPYCKKPANGPQAAVVIPLQFEDLLKEKEIELREEYEKILDREKRFMKERLEFILLNEQTRTSYMLREAHRERQEKIHALQTQLQCKNLAALMYVMCTERRRSRIEKLKIIKDYTNYIGVLQDILVQGQSLILHLSRGYKTAARVDHEWREKMIKVVSEFMAFIYNFAGGDPESNQYLLDLPKLLATKAPIVDKPEEDPCYAEEEEEVEDTPINEKPVEKFWWDDLDTEDRPFVMYGDTNDFDPALRREVLTKIRADKTAPEVWKKYAFKEMFLTAKCVNLDSIKDKYQLPVPVKWECQYARAQSYENGELNDIKVPQNRASKISLQTAIKPRTMSTDFRGMGSILKIISPSPVGASPFAKTAILAARDSMEIASTTRVRGRLSTRQEFNEHTVHKEVVLAIGKKRASIFHDIEDVDSDGDQNQERTFVMTQQFSETDKYDTQSMLGSIHHDSLEIKHTHESEPDRINYEKVCPMEQCQRLQVDSFMRSLPPYMRANPFTHFQQTFDEYETCTPEQLEILKNRIEAKKLGESKEDDKEAELESPLDEWASTGVGVQTSILDLLPPCTCDEEDATESVPSTFMFNVADLMPVKQAMDAIHRECFFNDKIIFDRFKVVGQDKDKSQQKKEKDTKGNINFKHARYENIKKILTMHPSLLEIFQANTK